MCWFERVRVARLTTFYAIYSDPAVNILCDAQVLVLGWEIRHVCDVFEAVGWAAVCACIYARRLVLLIKVITYGRYFSKLTYSYICKHARTSTGVRNEGTCLNILARDTYLFLAESPLNILHSFMGLHVRILDCACDLMSWLEPTYIMLVIR